MPFLFQGDMRVNVTLHRGIQYVTCSYYGGEKDVFQKVEEMMKQSLETDDMPSVTEESLVDCGIAMAEDLEYCVGKEEGIQYDEDESGDLLPTEPR